MLNLAQAFFAVPLLTWTISGLNNIPFLTYRQLAGAVGTKG
jgi:hypothetical protein